MKQYFNVHDNTKIWLGVSGLLVVASLVLWVVVGLRLGLDFTGGTLVRLKFDNEVDKQNLERLVQDQYGSNQVVKINESNEWSVKTKTLTEEEHTVLISKIEEKFGSVEETGLMSIGPVVSKSLRSKALTALIVALIGMIIYIAWEFRKLPEFLSSWKFGVVAVVALFHDVLITVGVFVILGMLFGVEVDTFFVTALLTILGYSVNDTIVIFDRIREGSFKSKKPFKEIAEVSVWDTMTRSINTSLTLLIALFSLLFFGPETLRYFVLALIVGAVVGTYSSIFVASPLLVLWQKDVKK